MKTGSPQGPGGGSSPFNRTAQHDAKRTAILSQAARLFNSKGSRATTLRDIAESLGLTKTSLYYYVKTKEELIYQCYMASLEYHHQVMDDIERQHDGAPARISAFYMQHFAHWLDSTEGRAPHIAVLLEIAGLKGEQREQVEAQYIAMFKRLRGYITDGIAAGEFRSVEPTLATLSLLGSVDWAFSWLHSIPRDNVMEIAEEALDLLQLGISVGKHDTTMQPIKEAAEDKTPLGFNREEQNRQKQEAFSQAGTWFFNKKGFNGTSLDEIAEHLNVSKGAFYYHIKNKEDLLFQCYIRSLDIVESIHQQAGETQKNGLQKAAFTCLRTFYAQNSEEGPLIRYTTITALPPERRQEILQRTQESSSRFGAFLNEGIEDGSVRPINTIVAQQLIAGAMNAAMDIELWRKVDDLDTAAGDYFDLLFNGLLPKKEDPA